MGIWLGFISLPWTFFLYAVWFHLLKWGKAHSNLCFCIKVQVRLRLQCQALPEKDFKLTIIDNYYGQSHFRFELDHAQASRLLSQFSSLAVAPGIPLQRNPPIWPTKQRFPPTNKINQSGVSESPALTDNFSNYDDSVSTSTASDNSFCINGNQPEQFDEKDLIYMKLKELSLSSKLANADPTAGVVGKSSISDDGLKHETCDDDHMTLGKRSSGSSSYLSDYPAFVEQVFSSFSLHKHRKFFQLISYLFLECLLTPLMVDLNYLLFRCTELHLICCCSLLFVIIPILYMISAL